MVLTMSDAPDPKPKLTRSQRRRRSILRALQALIRTRLTTGIVTILPVVITIWLIRLIYTIVQGTSQWVVEQYLLSEAGKPLLEAWKFDFDTFEAISQNRANLGMTTSGEQLVPLLPVYVQWGIPVVAILLTLLALYMIGFISAHYIGRRFVEGFESFFDRLPLIKTVYRGIKQVLSSLSGDQKESYQRVALIPFPQERMRCVGFITSIFKDSLTQEELATVFIPTTPNPTTGYLQILRRKELVELDWNVEDAVRTIMSGGIIRPNFLTIVPTKDMGNYPRPAMTMPEPDAHSRSKSDEQPD
jgi:uncharacterized membrane protein